MTPHEYLHSFTNYEANLNSLSKEEFNLQRIEELLGFLGDPQKALKAIHVAGTKGKGSTCAFMGYILSHAGYRVGLYTSPHLHRLNERIRILDQGAIDSTDSFYGMISDGELEDIIHTIRPHVAAMINRGIILTFFEILTVIAFVYFKGQNVDYVVLETGLGGRLDATNVAPSQVAVITPISLDHTHILGKDIAAIAGEKAGIIKNCSQRVVIAPQEKKAMDVLCARCKEFGIEPIVVEKEIETPKAILLKGAHQRVNASVAAHAVEQLKVFGSPSFEGIMQKAIAATRFAGRFELLSDDPPIIADGAHNQISAQALVAAIKDYYPQFNMVAVLGLSNDKDINAFVNEIKPHAKAVIFTKADHPRAHAFTPQEAAQMLGVKPWFIVDDIESAIGLAKEKAKGQDVIVITGSLFVVAQARKRIHVPVKK